jgi:hypothetical protein
MANMNNDLEDHDANDLDDVDQFDEYFDIHEPSDDYEDECASLRGTSQCDGLCDPQCDWCMISHSCIELECVGGPCPYELLDPSLYGNRDHTLGSLDAFDGTKRKRLMKGVSRRHYLRGWESWIRRKDPRQRAKEVAERRKEVDWSEVF